MVIMHLGGARPLLNEPLKKQSSFARLPIDSLMEMCGPFVVLFWAVFLAFIYCPPGLEKMLQCGCHASLGHCSWPHCVHLCSYPRSPTKHVESDCRTSKPASI